MNRYKTAEHLGHVGCGHVVTLVCRGVPERATKGEPSHAPGAQSRGASVQSRVCVMPLGSFEDPSSIGPSTSEMAMGQNPIPPVNIPILTKID